MSKYKISAVLALSTTLLFATSGVATAHVTVDASSTESNSRSVLSFRVPTESPTAETVGLNVKLPTETPFASVRVEHTPGWHAEVITSAASEDLKDDHGTATSETISEIKWTATASGIAPNEYADFRISVNPLPESGTLYFPTTQIYSDGLEVDWVQQSSGNVEAEKPAPSFEITTATDVAPAAAQESSSPALGISLAALGIAILAALVGAWTLVSQRR